MDAVATARLADAELGNPFEPHPSREAARAAVAEAAESPAAVLEQLVDPQLGKLARRLAVAIAHHEHRTGEKSRMLDPRAVPERIFTAIGLARRAVWEAAAAAGQATAAIRHLAGSSPAMGALRAAAWKACFGESIYEAIRLRPLIREQNVLILGETGTGKELLAQAIALADPDPNRAQSVNAAAIPRELLESELFGHVKGAFTTAIADREGKIAAADGGTLFLDEIGDLPLDLQAKLLRVVENDQVTPLGANRGRKVDVRYVCATSQPILELVERGKFRRDLYERFAGLTLTTPPLRERPDDLVPIADSLFGRYERLGASTGASTAHLSKLAIAQAQFRAWLATAEARARPWNGNVRELQSLMRSWILGFREGQKASPPPVEPARAAEPPTSPMARFLEAQASLREVEDWYILHVLASVQYRQRKAAEILGIDRGTLARRLRVIDPVHGSDGDE